MVSHPFQTAVRGFESLRGLRAELRAWLARLGVDDGTTADLVLAVSELATNAIEASPADEAQVEAKRPDHVIEVVIANEGAPFYGTAANVVPVRLGERGRGIDIATALVDRITFQRSRGCTEVTVVKSF